MTVSEAPRTEAGRLRWPGTTTYAGHAVKQPLINREPKFDRRVNQRPKRPSGEICLSPDPSPTR